jgi:hypothetical protein
MNSAAALTGLPIVYSFKLIDIIIWITLPFFQDCSLPIRFSLSTWHKTVIPMALRYVSKFVFCLQFGKGYCYERAFGDGAEEQKPYVVG